jgi:proteasome lid subunit RPN8/RPN11
MCLIQDENGNELRVMGWYHSHPHITVHPSAVDLRTQEHGAKFKFKEKKFIWCFLIKKRYLS